MPAYLEVKGMALLRAGQKLTPLRTSLVKLAALLSRRGVQGLDGFEGEERINDIARKMEEEFRSRYDIPEGEMIYVYRGNMSEDEFHYMLSDQIAEKGIRDGRSEEFISALIELYAPHIFRPHLEVSHLYAR